jgi:hypothetical protein
MDGQPNPTRHPTAAQQRKRLKAQQPNTQQAGKTKDRMTRRGRHTRGCLITSSLTPIHATDRYDDRGSE